VGSKIPFHLGRYMFNDHALGSIHQRPVLRDSDVVWIGAIFDSDAIVSCASDTVGIAGDIRRQVEI
jgi:hypothetical protein